MIMDIEEAKKIIKSNYPDERYTMLREALDWLIEEAEAFDKVKTEVDNFKSDIEKLKT